MIREVVSGFRDVGLDISAAKCHWSSQPPLPGKTLDIAGILVVWEETLKFVGTSIDLNGNDMMALENRIAQANKLFYCWKELLLSKWLAQRLRLRPRFSPLHCG